MKAAPRRRANASLRAYPQPKAQGPGSLASDSPGAP